MKIGIFTLGCRLNFAETEEIIEKLEKDRHFISFQNPDVFIVRGCSVTKKAEKETRQKIREIKKKFKNSLIIATGCLTDNFFLPEADVILPKKREKYIFSYLFKISKRDHFQNFYKSRKTRLKTRFFLKIQDGCQKFCAYCLVPYLRGKELSLSSKKIIKKIKEKEKEGFKEVILTGVNLASWREKKRNLTWLIKKILTETKIERIRISSLWPDQISQSFISLFKNPRLCPHLHLSLQSLSDSLLKKMGRFYQVKEIKNKIKKIKEMFPSLTLTADIIVGFPQETEKEFQETKENLQELKLAKLHVFRYSPRPYTRASLLKNQVPEKIKKERSKILLHLSKIFEREWRKKFINQIRNVLFEQKKGNFWQGLTDNYIKVFVKSKKNLSNLILPVKLEKLYKDGIIGKISKN